MSASIHKSTASRTDQPFKYETAADLQRASEREGIFPIAVVRPSFAPNFQLATRCQVFQNSFTLPTPRRPHRWQMLPSVKSKTTDVESRTDSATAD